MSKPISIRVTDRTLKRLDRLSQATDRSKSFLAAQAIEDFLDLQEWQVAAIQKGIAEAERGDVVTHEEALKALNKWGKSGCAD
jgi:RHH-type transcriptional regulator, rel operon repressor / antitoxin RelB